ncbi:MAG: GNAT family N-acetyltransferase, partial [Planctomycetota bacterium]
MDLKSEDQDSTPAVINVIPANQDDLAEITQFLNPFMDDRRLLRRSSVELQLLLKHSFKAISGSTIVGFCALEIYSKKLAEIQCLAVHDSHRRLGIGKRLVHCCVQRARDEKVKELMAISSSDEMFMACGFDYSLPHQKRA